MFTGIIEALGRITAAEPQTEGQVFHIETGFSDLALGESIAVNGTCLTVTEPQATRSRSTASFFLSRETLDKTDLGSLKAGEIVNLERALRLSSRLSGHLVQGHIDGHAVITSLAAVGDSFELKVRLSSGLLKYTVAKGSITLDGISLTINSIDRDILSLMIIPHTWTHTNLQHRRVGDALNVEIDIIAKYAERLCTPYLKS